MKVYTVQPNLKLGNIKENSAKLFSYLKNIKDGLVLLPEMWSSGFDNENLREHSQKTPEIKERLKEISQENKITVAGTLPELIDGKVFNVGYVVDNGKEIYRRAKNKLFKFTNEDRYFASGKENFSIVKSSRGKLGLIICFELRFPYISHILRKKGVEIILIPAQWGKARAEHFEILSRARAIETQSFVVTSNTVGKIDIAYAGYSAIYSPWGKTLVIANSQEGIFEAEIEILEVYKVRKQIEMD